MNRGHHCCPRRRRLASRLSGHATIQLPKIVKKLTRKDQGTRTTVSAKSSDIEDGICQENQAINSACLLRILLLPLGVSRGLTEGSCEEEQWALRALSDQSVSCSCSFFWYRRRARDIENDNSDTNSGLSEPTRQYDQRKHGSQRTQVGRAFSRPFTCQALMLRGIGQCCSPTPRSEVPCS